MRQYLLSIKNYVPQNDSVMNGLNAIDSMLLVHTSYRVDTLLLVRDSFAEYNTIIDELLIANTDSIYNSGHVYLDATSFIFKIKQGNNLSTIYGYSVNNHNYPLLAKYVFAIMQLYRSRKNDTFLDKSSTAGY